MKTSSNFFNNIRISATASLILLGSGLIACSSQQLGATGIAAGASCQQLGESEAALSSFYGPGSVVKVSPIREKVFHARALQPVQVKGAVLLVRAEPGMSAPYLRRVLACHAASGKSVHPSDPLLPSTGPVTSLAVSNHKSGFRVEIRAKDRRVGEEIWARAAALSTNSSSLPSKQLAQAQSENGSF